MAHSPAVIHGPGIMSRNKVTHASTDQTASKLRVNTRSRATRKGWTNGTGRKVVTARRPIAETTVRDVL